MPDLLARVSSKGQTVIPKSVRQKLDLKTGDLIRFHFGKEGAVTIDKVRSTEDDPLASFDEWTLDEDEKLYADL